MSDARHPEAAAPHRTWWDVMHPEEERNLRDLPRLIADSFRLVAEAGRRELLLTSALQLTIAFGLVVQLFVVNRLFDAVLGAGRRTTSASIVPELVALVAVGLVLSLAQAVQVEQSRILGELVGRRAFDMVLNVATRIDLLAFESPAFYDRLIRAVTQGQLRSVQIVTGLVGSSEPRRGDRASSSHSPRSSHSCCRSSCSDSSRCGSCRPRNSRDLYQFTRAMTPNDRQRDYLRLLLTRRDTAKEVSAFDTAGFLRRRYDRLYDERILELARLRGGAWVGCWSAPWRPRR